MASNLRSKPISGHVTDGAGNVIRNSQITIKSFTPTGDITVDSSITNDDGYFVTAPLPNGEYAIYDSGIMVSNTIHLTDPESIPVYRSDSVNVGAPVSDFNLVMSQDPNQYRVYFQIETYSSDVIKYGNTYPIYDVAIKGSSIEYLKNMADFHYMGQDSRITTTRFDIEYYAPITESTKTYRRVRWAGVPAIKYGRNTRLVIPVDYYSLVPTLPKFVYGSLDYVSVSATIDGYNAIVSGFPTAATVTGDIIRLEYKESNIVKNWYGINVSESGGQIHLFQWNSSRVVSDDYSGDITQIKAYVYDGMFPGLSSLNASTNEYITVVENVYAQDSLTELYEYK